MPLWPYHVKAGQPHDVLVAQGEQTKFAIYDQEQMCNK
jgi:hypothetical protein